MSHIHDIYELYIFLEMHRKDCVECREFQDIVVGNFIDMAEFLVEKQIAGG